MTTIYCYIKSQTQHNDANIMHATGITGKRIEIVSHNHHKKATEIEMKKKICKQQYGAMERTKEEKGEMM